MRSFEPCTAADLAGKPISNPTHNAGRGLVHATSVRFRAAV